MEKRNENEEINEIINRLKSEVGEGVKGKNMTITDISLKMTAAFEEIKKSVINEIEATIEKEGDVDIKSCPDCANMLKKTEN